MAHLPRSSGRQGGLSWLRVAALTWAGVAGPAVMGGGAANGVEPKATARGGETAAELARMDRELRELRATLSEVQKSEREHFEIVRRLLDKGGAAAASAATGGTVLDDGATGPGGAPEATGDASSPSVVAAPIVRPPVPVTLAIVTGRVRAKVPLHDVYVYLEGFRSNAGRKAELEIIQTHKSFEPAFAVALTGTRATFPNRDTFFHNVFSPAPTPFDLGTYRADEKAPSVTLSAPGVVEIFCNIHAQMQAQILVVPNRVYARVGDDGTFRLDKVPAGPRKLVAWGPGMRPVRIEVTVPAGGAQVAFDLEPAPPLRHPNKFGLPYGAYKD